MRGRKNTPKLYDALNGEIYTLTARRRNYIILRLDSFVAEGLVLNYNPRVLSIEHVLPQTVESGSQWEGLWTEADIQFWTHRIANLVPLTRRKNSAAQNFDFDKKKTTYFTKIHGRLTLYLRGRKIFWTFLKRMGNFKPNLYENFLHIVTVCNFFCRKIIFDEGALLN